MRRLLVWAPEGDRDRLVACAERHGGRNTLLVDGAQSPAAGGEEAAGPVGLVITHLPNAAISSFVEDVSEIEGLRISMQPQGALALEPPPERAPQEVADVTLRSPLEIVLASLQSVGSWRGFLAYAAVSGAVVWVGFFTNTVFLLVAAMLISPLAGPAMNGAIATARGDGEQIARSVARYLAALSLGAAMAAALTPVFGLTDPTTLMTDVATISVAAFVLPVLAGAAGAVNLIQSERSSLVSGAATGMLVAAALAPPMGLVGMGAVLAEWDVVTSAVFLLGLQLFGINLSGAIVFRLAGIRPAGARYERGQPWVQRAAAGVSLAAIAGFLIWQFGDRPVLQRESVSRDAEEAARGAIRASRGVQPIEVTARYTGAEASGRDALLVTAFARPTGRGADPARLERRLERAVAQRVSAAAPDSEPLVDVTVVGGR